jgi:hypothetical protein
VKPTVTNARYTVATLKRNKGFALFDGETVIGVIMRPREGKRRWGWAITHDGSYKNGDVVGMQSAMDALVAAYEGNGEA